MAMPFDATLKDMAREDPLGALATFDGPPTRPAKPLNVDLSTVTLAADLALGVGDPLEEVIHLDFQASAAAWKHADLMLYNAALYAECRVPVHTIVVLLRSKAAHRNMNGTVRYAARPGRGRMQFRYEVVRLWKRPTEDLLAGALGMIPLAVLGRLPAGAKPQGAMTAVVRRIAERLEAETTHDRKVRLLTSAYLLAGLGVSKAKAKAMFQGVGAMSESTTYNAIIEEGQEKEARRLLLLLGGRRFGAPHDEVKARLEAISDLERLERMHLRLPEAPGWQELLNTP